MAGIDCLEEAECHGTVRGSYEIVRKTAGACALLTATVNCAPPGHSILRLWRGPSSRACSAGGMAVFSYRKCLSDTARESSFTHSPSSLATHPSFIGLQERFLASLEMTLQGANIS